MMKLIMTTALSVTVAGAAFAQNATDGEMRSLTSSVLAGLGATAPGAVETDVIGTDTLKILVQQALSEGESDAYLEALLGEAADNGQIEVPDAMRTTDGQVDTRTLLASLVAKSEGVTADAPTAPLVAEAAGAVATTEVVAEAPQPVADRFHQVAPGDSLAAISITYYGDAQDYTRIFNANRNTLSSPNLIRVGQTLLIPS